MLNSDEVSDLITINKENKLVTDDKNIVIKDEIPNDVEQSANEETANENSNDKVFTVNDIQTLMDNQILHKSQLDQNIESNKLEQQHLILVTQNGDKIILIQNPSVTENQVQINSLNAEDGVDEINNVNEIKNDIDLEDTELILTNHQTSSILEDDDKQEEISRIQMQHKNRQRMLMSHLGKLREKHKGKFDNSETASNSESTNSQSNDDNFWDFNNEENNEFEQVKNSNKSKNSFKKKSIPIEKFYCDAKWYPPFCNYLEKAHNYVKRRSENIEQLSKFFPSASYVFESRCADLKKQLNKLELNLERFQNVLGKDLHLVEEKLKNFFQDYHLESIALAIEEDDKDDLKSFINTENNLKNKVLTCESKHTTSLNNVRNNSSSSYSSKMELITPLSISITPTEREQDEIDPVPEIRDVQCDVSLEEMGKLYSSNLNLNKSYTPISVNIKTRKINRKNKNDEPELKNFKHPKRN